MRLEVSWRALRFIHLYDYWLGTFCNNVLQWIVIIISPLIGIWSVIKLFSSKQYQQTLKWKEQTLKSLKCLINVRYSQFKSNFDMFDGYFRCRKRGTEPTLEAEQRRRTCEGKLHSINSKREHFDNDRHLLIKKFLMRFMKWSHSAVHGGERGFRCCWRWRWKAAVRS